jgi:SAM-dependent methyltransferase
MQRAAQPVSMWLVDHLGPQPGHTILELAAGPGDTGLLAAELVQPGGKVILTDGAEAMVEAARRRAEELGIANVEARQMEAEWIDLDAASIDGVLARWGYMLLADPEAALRETRRVLRQGGRVALAAWADPKLNPWLSALNEAGHERGLAERPAPDDPGPFRFAKPGTIEDLLESTGFDDVLVEPLDFTFAYDDLDAYFEHQLDLSTRLGEEVRTLSPAEHTHFRDAVDARLQEYVRADGSVELPARTWVAAASA